MIKAIWNNIFVDTYNKIEAEKSTSSQLDKRAITIFIVVAFSLVFIQYLGDLNFIKSFGFESEISSLQAKFPNIRLFQLTYWVSILIVFYLVIPLIIIKFIFKDKLSD
ncbi:MAG: hypothetical protein P8Q14_10830, partial [Vicingaceae bacterium]|nr:hypothetical protein [Vicingaceae bacterium]